MTMRHLNYSHLLYFWTVAREGSIAKASSVLHLTPQTISGQLKLLDESIGDRLFVRAGRRLVLSDLGKVVYQYADEIFSLGAELAHVARGKAPGMPLVLNVGIVDSIPKLVTYRVLEPVAGSAVVARLDTGDPWIVERPLGRGRVLLLAGPLDAEGGTLPVNPDFVPWVHTIVYSLADAAVSERPHRPGESLRVPLPATVEASIQRVTVLGPDGHEQAARVERTGPRAEACLDSADAPGLYEFRLPDGSRAHALVESDPRESEPEPLAAAEAETLARGWPLSFASDPEQLTGRLLSASGGGPRPFWKLLVLAALGGLCLEVLATRRLARQRGLAAGGADD
jgi:DNA-binding transcriptional LysR family regulator